ncbi:MAG: hypothetical protein DCC55_24795 [Chloroflexi bacterium]|nr:MAG: hypothetical protein DCC55_24795 [Chloroflexota bacterium]
MLQLQIDLRGYGFSRLAFWQEVATGRLLQTLASHTKAVGTVLFTRDGSHLVSASEEQTIRVWRRQASGDEYQLSPVLNEHTFKFTCAALTSDGEQVVSGGVDGAVRIWDLQTGEGLHTLRPEGPYAGTNITGVTGITAAQKAALLALGAVDSATLTS